MVFEGFGWTIACCSEQDETEGIRLFLQDKKKL
jgi:hypothetical protein